MSKATKIAVSLSLVSLLVAGCGGGESSGGDASDAEVTTTTTVASPGQGSSPDITIKNLIFTPGVVNVASGTRVTWTNADSFAHTVTSGVSSKADGKFDSELAKKGAAFSFTFNEPGTFPYFCRIHSGTQGEITVK